MKTKVPHVNTVVRTLMALLLLFIVSCTATEEATPTPAPTNTITPTATPTLTPSPIPPTATSTVTPTPAPLTPSAIFEQVAPSIAFIDTPIATGSGVLIEGGFILTNAHVVWPYQEVRIVFGDGNEFDDVPLLGADMMADLAVLGPIDTDLLPFSLQNGEDLVTGSTVFLVGYPGEVEEFPQATITQGIISRTREWESQNITHFQTDATISGGQSGGVLVSEIGEIIGLSGLSFAHGDFGLVASAVDIHERVEMLLSGEHESGFGDHWIEPTTAEEAANRFLLNPWTPGIYYVDEEPGTEVEVEFDGGVQFTIAVVSPDGEFVDFADSDPSMIAELSFTTEIEGPYFILVFSNYQHQMKASASVELYRHDEGKEGKIIKMGDALQSVIDIPGESDYFRIFLHENDVVHIAVDANMIDPFIRVQQNVDDELDQIVEDDDSGDGIFGTNAELVFRAPETDEYFITVEDASYYGFGAYTLTVSEPTEHSPTPMAPLPTAVPIYTDFGEMELVDEKELGFTIEYPITMDRDINRFAAGFGEGCVLVNTCLADEQTMLIMVKEDTSILGDITLDQYGEIYLDALPDSSLIEIVDRITIETKSGSALIITLKLGDIAMIKRLLYLQGNDGFGVTFIYTEIYPADGFEVSNDDELRWLMSQRDIDAITEYSFSTFELLEP